MRRLILAAGTIAALTGCADDPKRVTGDSCEDNAECASGVCFQQQCLAPIGAACEADADCASGRCAEGVCAEALGGAQETTFFVFSPRIGVEDNALGGMFLPAISYSETLEITRAGITIGAECVADAFFRSIDSGASPVRTTVRCYPDASAEPFSYEAGPGTMTIASEAESFTNDFGDNETSEAYDMRLIASGAIDGHPADADLLVGQGMRSYIVTSGNSQTRGREINGALAIRQSVDMQPSAVAGDWGFVSFQAGAAAAGPSASYASGFFTATVAQSAGAATLTPMSSRDFTVTQGLSGANGQPISVEVHDVGADSPLQMSVGTTGAVTISNSEVSFLGAASPDAQFMILVDSSPEVWPPFTGEGPLDEPNASSTDFVYIWGVKRAADPIATVAGRSYRVVRFAFRAEAGRFVAAHNVESPVLAFDATGATADFGASENEYAVSFAGGLFPKEAPVDLPTLNISAGQADSLAFVPEGADEPLANGYVSADGRIIVFSDASAELNAVGDPLSATLGFAVGFCANCDDAAAN